VITPHNFFPAVKAIGIASIVAFLYVSLFRTSYAWLSSHFQGNGDYRVYLKLLGALVFTFALERRFKSLGIQFIRRETLVAGMGIPALTVFVVYGAIGFYIGWQPSEALHYFCVALAEEIFFRGWMIACLRSTGILSATLISSLLFALVHFPNFGWGQSLFEMAPELSSLLCSGILLAGMRLYTDSLVPGILWHFLANYIPYSQPFVYSWLFMTSKLTQHDMDMFTVLLDLICLMQGIALLALCRKRDAVKEIRADR